MKKLILILLPVLVILSNCNNNDNIVVPQDNEIGNLLLRIDSENAPENVVWVTSYLTREGLDTITAALNLLSDTTAEISLVDILAGNWHLKVDASDSIGVVLYTGETDVQILAGFTTQVYLVLEPTGSGVGNIYIWVTWGTIAGNWNDYNGNPILSPSGSYWDYSAVSEANIFSEGSLLKMYYTAQGNSYSGFVGYAYSSDGINWTVDSHSPVLSPGPYGSWDESAAAGPAVLKEENGYKMYYCGWSDPYGPWQIGLATSVDGFNWVKNQYPVLYANGGQEYQIIPTTILKIDGTYYLYYYGRNLPHLDIRLATSTDGINWTRHPSNPILDADQSWEGISVYHASVYMKNNHYEMIYMNGEGTGFGKAISTDGINWTKDISNPFFTKNATHNNWANYKIAYPYFIRTDNQDRIYYTGLANNLPPRIGFTHR